MSARQPNRASSISERIYEMLLLLYPKKFRCEYGSGMAQVFKDLCREEQRRGRVFGLARL